MASAAANAAMATEVLAVQRLYYNITSNAAVSILLLFSSQLLGYGIGGVLRCEFGLDISVMRELTNYNGKQFCSIPQRCSTLAHFR